MIGSSYIYSSFGGSPPNESEFKESIIIFTIRICTDASNDPAATIGYNTLKISKEMLIGNWNSKNIIMLCINVLPSSTAFTTEAKLSSVSTMSDASFATSLPVCIPNPTSERFNAGESFTPSPVIATDLPIS